MKNILSTILTILLNLNLIIAQQDHEQQIHKRMTWEAYQLYKQSTNRCVPAIEAALGDWWQPFIEGNEPWVVGTIITGAFREDEEDVVYYYTWPNISNSHFWDTEHGNCSYYPEDRRLMVDNYCYVNSYRKMQAFWYGKKFENQDWLVVQMHIVSGPNNLQENIYNVYLSYSDLARVYAYNEIYVTKVVTVSMPPITIEYNPPVQFTSNNFQIIYGGSNPTRKKVETICWEIVGRICHLLGDNSVPAHVHNDLHFWPFSDYYESTYEPEHYQNYYASYIIQNFGGRVILWYPYIENPFKYALYTINQVADRFPDNGFYSEDGDNSFTSYPELPFYYAAMLQPIYDRINSSNPPVPFEWNNDQKDYVCSKIMEYSYVYAIQVIAGFLECVQAGFGLPTAPVAEITRVYQVPPLICKGSTGHVYVEPHPPGLTYNWRIVNPQNKPPSVEVQYSSNSYIATIIYHNTQSDNCNINNSQLDDIGWGLNCSVNNSCVSSVEMGCGVNTSTNCGGCPWLYVLNADTVLEADNNILHRSEFTENVGLDLKDLYKLRIAPLVRDSTISFDIYESESDYSYFDQFKLYAIDHEPGKRVGITEDNRIVLYDSMAVIDNLYSTLNGNQITDAILFHQPLRGLEPLAGDSLDHLYSLYPENVLSCPSIITELEYNDNIQPHNPAKNTAGILNANTNVGQISQYFARRELAYEVIIPLDNPLGFPVTNVSNIDIDYLRDFKVKYVALTSTGSDGFDTTNLVLIEAIHSDSGDVLQKLVNLDQQYAEMGFESSISLKFHVDNPVPSLSIREYLLETSGRYVKLGQDNRITKLTAQVAPLRFALNQNYPNPFNPITKIKFSIPKQYFVRLIIYDILGREVKALVNEMRQAGRYEAEFNGQNLASGVYIYRLEAGDFSETKKMVLIK